MRTTALCGGGAVSRELMGGSFPLLAMLSIVAPIEQHMPADIHTTVVIAA
ncbi:MAG: hypothetical protein IPJ33_11430 [Gammaproteobacteria bacterium]|jgi:hypothetical protein|nr:hypothetical protein [Gammaproteobacteria bacterium]MBP6050925.1 hypothetical protein [Pseudomonadales bacterium]MBK6582432.1 hypothetical protein [Gammaproteobacteria bacterium]MBK7169579.1 hypothetical protein [Gammaproteobacteria bacterium]MBK7521297.1 hypothetical protein [Gammaproteobacteria bacterium]